MAKTANLYARIEPDVKEKAEAILSELGLPVSNAISLFYKQIIFNKGLPFEVKLPPAPPHLDISKMTGEQLNAEIQKGYDDMLAGRGRPLEEVLADFGKDYGI